MSDQTYDRPELCGPHCVPRAAVAGEIDSLRGTRDAIKAQIRERDVQIATLQTAELEANALIASLTAERDKLKAGAMTVTFGDADATIAQAVAERDALATRLMLAETQIRDGDGALAGAGWPPHGDDHASRIDKALACLRANKADANRWLAERDAAQQEAQTLREALDKAANLIGKLSAVLPRPQEPQPMTMRPGRNHWLFVDERGDEWSLTPTHDPSMPLVIICEKRAPASQEPGGHQP